MILVAACHEGIGNSAFYETLKQFDTPDGVLQAITRENYKFGDHKAYKFASLAKESKITLVGELTHLKANQLQLLLIVVPLPYQIDNLLI